MTVWTSKSLTYRTTRARIPGTPPKSNMVGIYQSTVHQLITLCLDKVFLGRSESLAAAAAAAAAQSHHHAQLVDVDVLTRIGGIVLNRVLDPLRNSIW